MTLFLRLDAEQAEQFAEHVTSGAGLHRGHPLLMLRNPLLGSQRDQYSTLSGREALVAIAIKAWNAWREARRCRRLPGGRKGAGLSRFRRRIEAPGRRASRSSMKSAAAAGGSSAQPPRSRPWSRTRQRRRA